MGSFHDLLAVLSFKYTVFRFSSQGDTNRELHSIRSEDTFIPLSVQVIRDLRVLSLSQLAQRTL